MPVEWTPLWLSLKVAAVATLASLPAGVWLGWLMANRPLRGQGLVRSGAALPLALPPTVLCYWVLALLWGPGRLWLTWPVAVAAALFEAVPLLAVCTRVALEDVSRDYVRAARSVGASGWRVFWRVSLPLARVALLAAAALAFARVLGDLSVTILVASFVPGSGETLDAVLRQAVESGAGGPARVMAVVISFAVIAGLALANRLIPRQVPG